MRRQTIRVVPPRVEGVSGWWRSCRCNSVSGMNESRGSSDAAPSGARPKRRRWPVILVSVASAVVIFGAGTLTLKISHVASSRARSSAEVVVPQLDSAALQAAISSAPDRTTSVLAQVSGPAGHWSGTFGVADTATEAPVPADGRFRLGSVTKTFIATVVLQLVAENRWTSPSPFSITCPVSYPPTTRRFPYARCSTSPAASPN